MRKYIVSAWSSLLLLLLLCSTAAAQPTVLISELCDPRQNYLTDRFVEIYNAGPSSVDLTGWELVAVGNGGDVFTWPLSGSIAPGEALVAGDASPVVAFPVDFPQEAWSSNSSLWNGKVGDGAKLLDAGSTLVDYVVADGTRFENDDYVRNDDVTLPSTVYDPAQWTATPVDFPTDGSPGTHTVQSPVSSPTVSGLRPSPADPMPGQSVDVRAEVVDGSANLVSVEAQWGLSAASLSNTLPMATLSGDTYETTSPIAAQPSGTTVYYRVEATNDIGGVTTTAPLSFSVPLTVSIVDLQGQALDSPYDGVDVITSGVVTARYGSHYVLQDGSGPWSGIWATGSSLPAEGDSVQVRGVVDENSSTAFGGNTVLRDAIVLTSVPASSIPAASVVPTDQLAFEAYEGVLVRIPDGRCTDVLLAGGDWEIDDGSGPFRVGSLGITPVPVLGTRYEVTGPIGYSDGAFAIEPSQAGGVVVVVDDFAPLVSSVQAVSVDEIQVDFTETVDAFSAGTASNFMVSPSVSVLDAQRSPSDPSLVVLTVSTMVDGTYSLDVSGVEDLFGNVVTPVSVPFDFVDISPPPGFYDSAEGLYGETLRAALHLIIDGHSVQSYDSLWTHFQTTDDKPNGKVWDMYSDVPEGTPPYEYTFVVDEGGGGATEGEGYNREHSWPKSWYGGDIQPMFTDLFMVYPTDTRVNNFRGNLPYGEVGSPDWVSLNGSERGPNTTPGYTGQVFEPIDAYKGDFARSYFYVMARYYQEDGSWPGSDMTDGSDLLPWAEDMLLEWHEQDPVSRKEIERNQAVYEIQNNRNPFIDRPEFVLRLFSTSTDAALPEATALRLERVAPNPFNPSTSIRFSLPETMPVHLSVYDAAGRRVRKLIRGEEMSAGPHDLRWNGRDDRGQVAATGVYFLQLRAGEQRQTQRMTLLK